MVEVKGRVCAQIKALPADPQHSSRGPFEGDLSTYGNIDLGGDICEAGCFNRSIAEQGTHRPLLWQHRQDDPIGSFEVVTTEGSLRIKGEFNLDTEHGRAGYSLLKHGDIDGLSIGYNARDYSYDRDGVRHLLDVDLMEGSLVTFPMNPQARAEAKSRRHARMSRFAKCAFLTKMTDEERAQALAELDQMDGEGDEGAPADPEPSRDAPAQDPPEPPKEEPQGTPDEPPAQPESTDTEQSESEVAKVFREVGQALIELRNLMEA